MRADDVAKGFYGADRLITAVEWNKELGLQFVSARRREVQFEVWEPLVPGPRDVELIGAGIGRVAREGMKFFACESGVVEPDRRCGRATLVDAALDPDLAGATVLPIRKNGNAVARSHDVGKVVLEFVEGKVLVHDLRHFIARLDREGDMSDDAKGAERDDGSGESIPIFIARKLFYSSVRSDKLDGGNCGRKIAAAHAGAMGCGGASSANGDMRQRSHVVERKPFCIENNCQIAIADARPYGGGACFRIDGHAPQLESRDLRNL